MNKELIEIKYSHKILTQMRTINGIFDKELKKLKKHNPNEPLRYRIFKPEIPTDLSIEDLKTIVDLAIFAGCRNMIMPNNMYLNNLIKRASIYGLNIETK